MSSVKPCLSSLQRRRQVFRTQTCGALLTRRTVEEGDIHTEGAEDATFVFLIYIGEYDGAEGYWLQDEDTLEEGFLANEDETVFWVVDDHEAFAARRFREAEDQECVPARREEQKVANKDHEAASGPIAQKGEPTKQTVKSIHPMPVTTVKEKEKEGTKVVKAKEKVKEKKRRQRKVLQRSKRRKE